MDNANEARSPKVWVWLTLWVIALIVWLVAVLPLDTFQQPWAQESILGYVLGLEALFGGSQTIAVAAFLALFFISWLAFLSPGLGSTAVGPGGHRPSRVSILGVSFPGALVMTGFCLTLVEAFTAQEPLEPTTAGMLLAGLIVAWYVVWVIVFNIKWRGGTRLAQMYRMTIGVFWVAVLAFVICGAMDLVLDESIKSCVVLAASVIVWALGAHAVVGILQNKFLAMTDQSVCSFCGTELSEPIKKGETACPACDRPIPAWARPRDGAVTAPAGAEPQPAAPARE